MVEIYSLYLMELLMQSNGALSFEDAWQCFLSRFPQAWGNFTDFESFVLTQSVLFGSQNNLIFLKDMQPAIHAPLVQPDYNPMLQYAPVSIPGPNPLMQRLDISSETEAVKYFQRQISRRNEQWVQTKSLAGHLSQAAAHIRAVVGPQSDFIQFLRRHPRIFEVQGDLVSLRDEAKFDLLPRQQLHRNARQRRPMSMVVSSNPPKFPRAPAISDYLNVTNQGQITPPQDFATCFNLKNGPYQQPSTQNILVTLADYYAVMWLRQTIERISGSNEIGIHLPALMNEFVTAPENVRNTIGWTLIEIKEFIGKFGQVFEMDKSICKNRQLDRATTTFIISDPDSTHPNSTSLINKKGITYCVMKSWGIIDLGQHEHVFFDRSILKNVGDLTKHFKVGETLCFNAVLAPKESRAKWRATHIWNETDLLAAQLSGLLQLRPQTSQWVSDSVSCSEGTSDSGVQDATVGRTHSRHLCPPTTNIDQDNDEDMQRLLNNGGFNVVRLDNAATDRLIILQEPNEVADSDDDGENFVANDAPIANCSCSANSSRSDLNTMSDIPSISSYNPDVAVENTRGSRVKCTESKSVEAASVTGSHASASTQTYFTGDILAKKIYHDGDPANEGA